MLKESWQPADKPPTGEPDKWSREVVVVTNLGDTYVLTYYNGKDGGVWQRLSRFNSGEQVEHWIDLPPF